MVSVSGLYHPRAYAEYLQSQPWDYSVQLLCDVSESGLCHPARSDQQEQARLIGSLASSVYRCLEIVHQNPTRCGTCQTAN